MNREIKTPPMTLGDYIKVQYVTSTATISALPTKEECIREITYHAEKLVNKKWWQDRSYNKKELKRYLKLLAKENDDE